MVRRRISDVAVGVSAQWVFVVQVPADLDRVVEAFGFEDVGDVAAGEDDDGVAVFTDFGVSLGVKVGGGDQDAELAVAKPRDAVRHRAQHSSSNPGAIGARGSEEVASPPTFCLSCAFVSCLSVLVLVDRVRNVP